MKMVMSCAAFACTNRYSKDSNVSFYSFPISNPVLCNEWERNIRRKNFKPSKYHKVCSQHFEESCFYLGYVNIRKLKPDAVPTIFDFPSHLQKTTKTRKPPPERNEGNGVELPVEPIAENVESEHNYNLPTSPNSLKRKLDAVIGRKSDSVTKARKQLCISVNKCRRQQNQITNLTDLIDKLKSEKLLSDRASEIMNTCSSDVTKEIFNRIIDPKNAEYCDVLKSFALTLHFYSPAAYRFVRSTLQCCLPHPSPVRRWHNSVEGKPGFSEEALSAIKVRVACHKGKVYGTIVMEEMCIRKAVEWDGSRFVGYVDLGGVHSIDASECEVAKEVLVLMVVALNTSWKIPIAYFMINSLSAEDKASIVVTAIHMLEDCGVQVVALTFDGLRSNLHLVSKLGANLSLKNMVTCFTNPVSHKHVYIILDACHMLKLIRNIFGDMKELVDSNGNKISWQFIGKLNKLQKYQGLSLANKIKENHVNFKSQKMKVHLAAQVLSNSVAKALDYLENDLKDVEFKGAAATAKFCSLFDRLFDLCNSKNPFAKGYKAVL